MLKKLLLGVVAFFAMVTMAFAAIDINNAGLTDLEKLPGIGPSKAQAIIDYRQKNGQFKSLEDLKKVKGIGEKTYDKLKSQIALSGSGKTVDGAAASKSSGKPATAPAPAATAPASKPVANNSKK